MLDLRVCYNGEWYNTRLFPTLIGDDSSVPQVDNEQHKVQLQKMAARKGELLLLRYFTPSRAEASR